MVRTAAGGPRRNVLLEWHRVQKGWARRELASQVNASINQHGDDAAPVTEDTVKNWERSYIPRKEYSKHLCLIFERPASELGLLTDSELALRPLASHTSLPVALSGIVGSAAAGRREGLTVTSQHSGPNNAGSWIDAQKAAGVPLDDDGPEILAGARHLGTVVSAADPRAVMSYASIVAQHRELYWHCEPTTLLDAAQAHLGLGISLLEQSPLSGELASAVAECALLVARLAFFDIDGQQPAANSAFETADEAVSLARDHSLAVAVAAHRAFVPGFGGDASTAAQFLRAAEGHYRRSASSPLVRSWLHCVSAEIHARTGRREDSMYHIHQASDLLNGGSNADSPPLWLDFFDSSRWAGFAGNTALLAGRHTEATAWLQDALDKLGADSAKQRAVLLLDLAAAHAPTEPERALALASDACEQLESVYYSTAVKRIPGVRAALSGSRYSVQLGERARALLTVEPSRLD